MDKASIGKIICAARKKLGIREKISKFPITYNKT